MEEIFSFFRGKNKMLEPREEVAKSGTSNQPGQRADNRSTSQLLRLQTAIYQTANIVTTYQGFVQFIGTSKDTPVFRKKLHQARQLIGNLLQTISAQLEQDGRDRGDAEKTAEYAKLAKDLAAIFREFQDAKRLEAEKEVFSVTVVLQQASILTSRSKTNEGGMNADQNSDLRDLLEKFKRLEALLLESESSLKEILRDGEEDEEEVCQIQREINSLRASIDVYKFLITEQVHDIDDIESALQFSTAHRTLHCNKATGRRSNLQFLDCFCRICGPCFLLES